MELYPTPPYTFTAWIGTTLPFILLAFRAAWTKLLQRGKCSASLANYTFLFFQMLGKLGFHVYEDKWSHYGGLRKQIFLNLQIQLAQYTSNYKRRTCLSLPTRSTCRVTFAFASFSMYKRYESTF